MYITAPKQERRYIYFPQAGGDAHILPPSRRGRILSAGRRGRIKKEGLLMCIVYSQGGICCI